MRFLLLLAVLAACTGCMSSQSSTQSPTAPLGGYTSETFSSTDKWVCHPDLDNDACHQPLDATVIAADGEMRVERHVPAPAPSVDCFYVYPTVSRDSSGNANLAVGAEERYVTWVQAARYTSVCRTFAPVYRQTTLASIFNPSVVGDRGVAYADVLDAFRHYIANENGGRGIIFVGHSQGAHHLKQLIADVIEEDSALLEQLVAAHLIGYPVAVPEGAGVGGSFDRVPSCTSADQVGCVVSYMTFRRGDPDLASGTAVFGRPTTPYDGDLATDGLDALCTNPAALTGATALTPYFPTRQPEAYAQTIASAGPFADGADADRITTPFYTTPGMVAATCATTGDLTVLEAYADLEADDVRGGFGGELLISSGWGLHFVDMTLAQGTLVELARRQAAAWQSK